MNTKQLLSLLLCSMSMVLFLSSCNKIKDISVSERKSIKIKVETEVKNGAVTYSLLRAGEINTFSGSANINLSEMPELNGFDLSDLKSVTVKNVVIGTSCTEAGDFYVENINIQTTGASATVNRIVVGESVSNNNDVNTLIQTLLTNLLNGNAVSISISGRDRKSTRLNSSH